MNEKEKLKESKFFYSKLIEEKKNREISRYYLSAFLSSAQTVMQYSREDARRITGGQKWYDDLMTSSPVLGFFKTKRNFNIHTAPIDPQMHTNMVVTDVLGMSESVHIKVTDKDGRIKEEREIVEESKPKKILKPSVKTESYFVFGDWSGQEDVITLCGLYINELEKVVQDGFDKGFLRD